MATVEQPSASLVVTWTGLNRLITGATEAAFLAALEEQITTAADATALAVGETAYDGTWTERKARHLARAIAFRAAALSLNVAWLQYATGTQEPLLMDPDSIEAARASFQADAESFESLVTSGTEQSTFALPAVGASTFSVSSSDRTPSERLALIDERDNVSASDVENG